MAGFTDKLKHAWNAFAGEEYKREPADIGGSYGHRPDRTRLRISNERSIISAIYTRLSIDVASMDMRHVRLDNEGRYSEDIVSGLNNCLTLEANIDQEARAFRQDIAMTLFDKGTAAIVPVETSTNPDKTGSFDIQSLRVGDVTGWYPRHVKVNVYDDRPDYGRRREIVLHKSTVAIIDNPLHSVMNEPNSTLQRLIRKLNLLDMVDEASSSGKLDLIIQLPYTIRSEARRTQANQRARDIESQLKDSQYGIAYTDATEKVIQLNRPADNHLWKQVTDLTDMLYAQLGLTPEVMNGTADEKTMLNYYNRTIEPVTAAITGGMRRTFLTKTARTQGQSVQAFRDPFKLVPIENMAEIADKFTRNEILSSNELRSFMGIKPSKDPKADELRNSNMPAPSELETSKQPTEEEGDSQNGT